MTLSRLAKAALWYAGHGCAVFPLHTVDDDRCSCGKLAGKGADRCEDAGKHPIAHLARNGVKNATKDASIVRDWWERCPDANIGLATGKVGGVVVIDIDPRHGGDRTLAALEAKHGKLPTCAEVATGGGGRHLFFAPDLQPVRNDSGGRLLGAGVDVRGEGGYVVAPPSIHRTGAAYRWTIPLDMQSRTIMPSWMLAYLRTADNGSGADGPARRARPRSYWRQLAKIGVSEGQRNDTLARYAGRLLRLGLDFEESVDLLLCWSATRCKPPLSEQEVVKTVRSIAAAEARRRRRSA
jgi:hypothetical protein